MIKNFKKILWLFASIGFVYIMNKIILLFSIENYKTIEFEYSLALTHLIFASFSLIILLILIKVKRKNSDSVGNTFLLLTTLKMIACFVIAKPILEKEQTIEKWNFFVLFMIYLLLETLFTIKLLNEKN